MRIEEVLPAFRAGKKIRRAVWKDHYFLCTGDAIHPDGVQADDWEVMTEPVLYTKTVYLANTPDGTKDGVTIIRHLFGRESVPWSSMPYPDHTEYEVTIREVRK